MKRALFPGTFDPPSLGHVDIIQRASKLCDKLYVGVAINPAKISTFSAEERVSMLKKITRRISNVEVVSFSSLVVHYAKKNKIDYLIRSLRAFSDFEFEFRNALANRRLSGLETLFLMADEKHAHLSSTLIREIALFHTRLHDFVPASIETEIYRRLSGPTS